MKKFKLLFRKVIIEPLLFESGLLPSLFILGVLVLILVVPVALLFIAFLQIPQEHYSGAYVLAAVFWMLVALVVKMMMFVREKWVEVQEELADEQE
jgi:hypothetical protein